MELTDLLDIHGKAITFQREGNKGKYVDNVLT